MLRIFVVGATQPVEASCTYLHHLTNTTEQCRLSSEFSSLSLLSHSMAPKRSNVCPITISTATSSWVLSFSLFYKCSTIFMKVMFNNLFCFSWTPAADSSLFPPSNNACDDLPTWLGGKVMPSCFLSCLLNRKCWQQFGKNSSFSSITS